MPRRHKRTRQGEVMRRPVEVTVQRTENNNNTNNNRRVRRRSSSSSSRSNNSNFSSNNNNDNNNNSSTSNIHTEEDEYHDNNKCLKSPRMLHPTTSSADITAYVPGIGSELKKHLETCQLIERDVISLLQRRAESSKVVNDITFIQNLSPNEVIRLNVGDEIFTVPIYQLLSKDGNENYFDILLGFRKNNNNNNNSCCCNSYYAMQPPLLDETGALFIDRDPSTFRLILNFLRGYRMFSMLSEDQLSMLKVDARYFQLQELIKELGDESVDNVIRFRPGPGVSPERNRFRVIYSVATVGNRFLITGRHRITFQILNSDYVGIGLVSDSCVSADQEFHKTSHCCVYYMTGVFYSNFPHHRKEDGLEGLEKDDYVSLMVDMNKRVAEYTLKKSTKMISLGNARKLRFAVAMKLSSSVRIVPEEEAQQLPLFQKKISLENVGTNINRNPTTTTISPSSNIEQESLTQMSQPNGAGAIPSSELQEQSVWEQQQLQLQQQQQQGVTPLFIPRVLDGNSISNTSGGLGRRAGTIVLGSFTSGPLPNEMSEIDPILFVSGLRERREDA